MSYKDNIIKSVSVLPYHITVFITVHLLSSRCIWHKNRILMNCPLWNLYFLFYCASVFLLLANCNNKMEYILLFWHEI